MYHVHGGTLSGHLSIHQLSRSVWSRCSMPPPKSLGISVVCITSVGGTLSGPLSIHQVSQSVWSRCSKPPPKSLFEKGSDRGSKGDILHLVQYIFYISIDILGTPSSLHQPDQAVINLNPYIIIKYL